ncbi:MAG: N-acetyltransferase [Deltaproteobacteria bacterium]|nr:N-acetyltransferase [Deltaproteobacteria bacterium]
MSSDLNDFFVHESSFVDTPCKIGKGTKIWHFSHIMKNSFIGDYCNIGQNVFVAEGVKIGSRVKIQNGVSVYNGVTLEDDVFVGPGAVFTNVSTPRSFIDRSKEYAETLIKKGATIGANATIVCGHTVGEYSFVAAGSVVTKDVAPFALVMGNPAKVAGWMCRCGARLGIDNLCNECGEVYTR